MNKTRMFFRLLGVAACLFAALFVWDFWHVYSTQVSSPASQIEYAPSVQIGGQTVHVSIADTSALRQQGLSGRDGLAPDEGMLFVFQSDGKYGFWMKDMRFSIDIVWIDADGRIVHIADSVSPSTYPQSFSPPEPSRYVLELPAGYTALHNIVVGDIVRL